MTGDPAYCTTLEYLRSRFDLVGRRLGHRATTPEAYHAWKDEVRDRLRVPLGVRTDQAAHDQLDHRADAEYVLVENGRVHASALAVSLAALHEATAWRLPPSRRQDGTARTSVATLAHGQARVRRCVPAFGR